MFVGETDQHWKQHHMLAVRLKGAVSDGRSALKEQTARDLREMLKLDGSSISQATLTVRAAAALAD